MSNVIEPPPAAAADQPPPADVWNYQQLYDTEALQHAADAASSQGENLHAVTCRVRDEENHMSCVLNSMETNKFNNKVHGCCSNIANYIETYLIPGRLTHDDERLESHEKAIGVMVYNDNLLPFSEKKLRELCWKAKISKMFIESYESKDNFLQTICHSLCITNPSDQIPLTGSEAYLQKLEVSHSVHLPVIYDCNPNHFEFENRFANMSKKSCSNQFWRRECQCDVPCHPRCALLDRIRFENEVSMALFDTKIHFMLSTHVI